MFFTHTINVTKEKNKINDIIVVQAARQLNLVFDRSTEIEEKMR